VIDARHQFWLLTQCLFLQIVFFLFALLSICSSFFSGSLFGSVDLVLEMLFPLFVTFLFLLDISARVVPAVGSLVRFLVLKILQFKCLCQLHVLLPFYRIAYCEVNISGFTCVASDSLDKACQSFLYANRCDHIRM
jgi:hypothetical protein